MLELGTGRKGMKHILKEVLKDLITDNRDRIWERERFQAWAIGKNVPLAELRSWEKGSDLGAISLLEQFRAWLLSVNQIWPGKLSWLAKGAIGGWEWTYISWDRGAPCPLMDKCHHLLVVRGFCFGSAHNLPAMQETQIWSLSWEGPLEKEMTTHSSILAWRLPWTEELGGL